ncbi:MAG TPA: M2 family metallopeptidase [Oligoflexus sp.]|uniref:M2 family metallopeptidase n=1 Tax=Oligoflexus sp. TaxID=1971216 RepID=UPI002D6502F2|nr:M2 family metallopeptidase [Oligoflexus sp.]HYX35261.1 M2 family metallopeptidase [Oligoflexus sp.]
MKHSISGLGLSLVLGLSSLVHAAADKAPVATRPATVEEAKAFVAKVDKDLRRLLVTQSKADWAKQTNITPATESVAAAANAEYLTYSTQAIQDAARFLPILDKRICCKKPLVF